jgi:phospho-N-acetylmuramoyl-pentapeptide-transferase
MFSIFAQYPTFLVFLAVVLGMFFTLVLMPPFIKLLRRTAFI